MSEVDAWEGDVLERRQHARYLTKLLGRQFEVQHRGRDAGAVCLALDGDWGVGKTFFVQRWAKDLENEQHPVVRFDAWKHDLTDDALVGFMSELSTQLKVWTAKLPPAQKAKVISKLKAFIKQAGRVVRPVTEELAKGVLKKVAGVSVDAITESLGASQLNSGTDGSSEGSGITEKVLDKFFEKTLDAHSKRQEALESLKETLALLVATLEESGGARLPFYVFIDELDRCRPDYAIRLLEGVKHLFDATGVCFVFSTNMAQLAHSVRAVYGQGFDGAFYLKRFFTFEYVIPEPDHVAFAQCAVSKSFFASEFGIVSGLPGDGGTVRSAHKGEKAAELASLCFAKVAHAFQLDLRSQSQVLRHAEAATVEFQQGTQIHALFLFFLAAVFHRSRVAFASLEAGAPSKDAVSKAGYVGATIPYYYYDELRSDHTVREVPLTEAIDIYIELSKTSPSRLLRMMESRGSEGYPASLRKNIIQPYFGRAVDQSEQFSISNYAALVKYAGQTVARRAQGSGDLLNH